jgi:translation initiation factor 3 subunit A
MLYELLQERFDPLELCKNVAPVLVELAESSTLAAPTLNGTVAPEDKDGGAPKLESIYRPYLQLLHHAILSKLLSHLSQVYTTLNISFLLELVQPLKALDTTGTYDEMKVIGYIMGCARKGELGVRVDCRESRIDFVAGTTSSAAAESDDVLRVGRMAVGEEIQKSVPELVNKRLSSIGTALWYSLNVIEVPEVSEEESYALSEETKKAIIAERKSLSSKLALLGHRNQLTVEHIARLKQESQRLQQESMRAQSEQILQKQKEDLRQKDLLRIQQEREAITINEAKKYAKTLVDGGVLKQSQVAALEAQAAAATEEGKGGAASVFNPEKMISMHVEVIEKEKKETSRKVKLIQKRIDHLERSIRREERPLLEEDYKRQQVLDREMWERANREKKEMAREQFKADVETKERLARMMGDYEEQRQRLLKKKGEEYAKKKDVAAKKIAEEKAKRKKTIMAKREEERKKEEEEERLRREEEERMRAEEEGYYLFLIFYYFSNKFI